MRIQPYVALSALLVAAASLVVACTTTNHVQPRAVTVPLPATNADKPTDFSGIHNVVAFGPDLYSGSAPEGDAGFDTLANLGIRTIISVDGATTEVEEAEERGIRYVHFPVSYSGIDEERRLEIARAVRDLPGPVYLHCHHGKHRSAAASAAAAVMLGRLDNDTALARMKISKAAPSYKGLYLCATETRRLSDAEISKAPNDFPSRWKTSGMVDSMVAIEDANDQLEAIEKAEWSVPKDHPDLVPCAVAGNLENLLRGLLTDPETLAKPQEFRDMLKTSADAAQIVEDGINDRVPAAEMTERMKRLAQSCKTCHVKYRD